MKNLFICITPLQCIIVGKIIKNNKLKAEDCELFFFSPNNNQKINYYYNRASQLFKKSFFYQLKKRFPYYMLDLKKKFSKQKYDNIYLACIDSIITHYILSFASFKNLFTFDDGLGNLLTDSYSYYHANDHPFVKKYIYSLLGNQYSTKKIKKETALHYTIYQNKKNVVSNNVNYIGNIFDTNYTDSNKKKNECNVIIGTVFSEYFRNNKADEIQKKFNNFLKTLKMRTYYIPHPRSEIKNFENIDFENNFTNIKVIKSEKISEEILIDLSKGYNKINLYGFCSSVQFHLINEKIFKHYVFVNDEDRVLKGWYNIVEEKKFEAIDIMEF